MPLRLPDIETAMTPDELRALARRAKGCYVLEMGSEFGASTVVLSHAAYRVVSIDWHKGDEQAGMRDSLDAYFANLSEHECSNVISIVGRFEDTIPLLRPGFDLVLVDGFHEKAAVLRDAQFARDMVTVGGTIAFHDWGRYDVKDALYDLNMTPFEVVDTLAFVRA